MGFILLRLFAAAAAVLCAAALIKRRRVRKSGGFAIAGMVLGLLLFAVSFLPSLLFTDYEGLEPTGEYEVGQARAILVDKDRAEAFESDGSRREVPVYFYYPENGDATEEGFPLVVFSHGAFGYYQSNVSAYLELASHGYVVVSLDHPYHSFFTTDTQGKRITVDPGFMREVMGANQDNMSQEEIWELSRGWLELRTQDMDFVIDSMKDAAEEAGAAGEGSLSSAWFFESDEQERGIRGALAMTDIERIGLMGHSLGGAASVTVGRSREDIGAVADLDGTMLGEETGFENGVCTYFAEPYPVPLLMIDNEEHYRVGREAGALYVNSFILENAVCSVHTYFEGSGHMNFTDLPLFSPPLASLLGTGNVDARECIETMNSIILQFFDYYLKGQGELSIAPKY